jgi:hypothetical protein
LILAGILFKEEELFYVVCIAGLAALTITACVGVVAAARSYNVSMKLPGWATEKMIEEERQDGDSDERKA